MLLMRSSFVARGLAALLSSAIAGLCMAQEATPGGQWLTYNNNLDGQRFSPLKEITPANAAQLGEVCRVQIDGPTSMHSDLIVADGVIYTGTGRETVAINATNCAVIWRYTYVPDEDRNSPSTRGVALMNGRLYRGTSDDRLIALDAASGRLLWKTVIGSPDLGESSAAAPLAWGGVVYMGISGSELGARGRVMAFDAQTGRELWRFNTIPMGNEVGASSWSRPGTAKTGGGGVWGAMTLDVTAGELFVPVGNPWPDIDKAYRPGANLFTDSIVVLDARTGALKWWHQGTPEDWMDLDMVAPPVLYRIAGARDYLVFGGKDGYVTAVDRDTHQVLFRVPVTTIEHMPKEPTREGMKMCPGYAGGVEWNGPAFDRLNHSLVTGAVDACFIVKLGKASYAPGGMNFGGSVEPVGPTTGWITSIDSVTGAVRWKFHTDKPVVAGITPTAGGVTFAGDLGGDLYVFDSRTGAVLDKVQTRGSLAGGLVTYERGGRQYVAFADGNVSRNAFGALGLPSVVIMALNPKSLPAVAAPAGAPGAGAEAPTRAGPAGAPDAAAGRRLYSQVCVACHGPEGNLVADHRLSAAVARQDRQATITYIKSPKPPMPKLYPDLLNDQSISDVTEYLYQQWGKHD
ncbi:MAG TPA: PQQ-binding-like beta-propeller repeat protein [Steroidobacteraceae bacterium]|nr:PQQ-binding-like beta-propeller repeat protein [Steroidobacteraceae bacterium]